MSQSPEQSPLGKHSSYISQYQPGLLFAIPRQDKRNEIKVPTNLPFRGFDLWNAYELSYLNQLGKPEVAIGELIIPCESPSLIESKSLKLYLNSFNNSQFRSLHEVSDIIQKDISAAADANVSVRLDRIQDYPEISLTTIDGYCLDDLDINCDIYQPNPKYLQTNHDFVTNECVYSDLLKSNCLVTGQPDWGTVIITYSGQKIDHENLLRYIVSYRNHNEFHEQCVERIFMDILNVCKPEKLSVEARYTRRGGLDINPYRTTDSDYKMNYKRLCRQ